MQCPGQDTRYWKADAIFEAECPECGRKLEFFKDDASRRCKQCGTKVLNPHKDYGCATYCKYAEQCLQDLPPEMLAERADLLKDRVAVEMKHYFGDDFRRIAHAMKVARYAERIAKLEKADLAVVLIAAYLHDIGIKDAERLHNSSAARYQEELGPPIARGMLAELGAHEALIAEVCDIIGHHHSPHAEETLNFKALYDADLLVNLEDDSGQTAIAAEKVERIINKSLFTDAGRALAAELFLK